MILFKGQLLIILILLTNVRERTAALSHRVVVACNQRFSPQDFIFGVHFESRTAMYADTGAQRPFSLH